MASKRAEEWQLEQHRLESHLTKADAFDAGMQAARADLLKRFYAFLPPDMLESTAKEFGQYSGEAIRKEKR